MKINISIQAHEDIRSACHYIKNVIKSPIAADKLYEKIYNKIDLIRYTPEAYLKIKTHNKEIIRYISADSYNIYYIFDKKHNTIKITRVIYSKRNINDKLLD